ncbi:PREDICTED: probable H/ACA ribonucleoprotein complex subunit 1 isoform X1 [Amphimedon queenslandica]|uniref:H/ACA ribonucleoprotein complex subunit n=1 Tax=Amphimedon queenslandica TaxID=400682 RepID=A0AAN0IXB7_AMPQE|nr:PREDICTED: probable H/ACA ribonucleoprotein complex subunit 1 isoform X1 [Amphimedon queenslandica]|eukprot:XP_019849091.1 PREDICTED: probable H/ACA ribonucleoprotein complex subunit 1 isoform X1 [Amphimedon queenslandica]
MSYRGRGGGGGRGFGRGGRGGRGRGGGGYQQDLGPPEHVVEVGTYLHPCENDLVCKSSIARVPYFNAPIYLENKSQVGKIDEIFGPFNEFMFSVKLSSDMLATSFSASQKLYIDPMKLLPLSRFLPQPKGATGRVEKRGGRGGGRGGRGQRLFCIYSVYLTLKNTSVTSQYCNTIMFTCDKCFGLCE